MGDREWGRVGALGPTHSPQDSLEGPLRFAEHSTIYLVLFNSCIISSGLRTTLYAVWALVILFYRWTNRFPELRCRPGCMCIVGTEPGSEIQAEVLRVLPFYSSSMNSQLSFTHHPPHVPYPYASSAVVYLIFLKLSFSLNLF